MSSSLRFVQGDTLPLIFASLVDDQTGLPIDLSTAVSIVMQIYSSGTLVDTLTGTAIAGLLLDDYMVQTVGYSTPGTGGRVSFALNATTLQKAGQYVGQIVVTFSVGQVQTVWDLVRLDVRAQP